MLDSSDRVDRQIDLWSTVVLTIASVLTAWSAFQSTKWTGQRAIAFNHASAARVDANRASNLANEQTEVDVELFVAWLEATAIAQKDKPAASLELAPVPNSVSQFLYDRFPPTLRKRVDAWLATKPGVNPDAPSSPFAMPEYQHPARAEAERLISRADELSHDAVLFTQRADNYVATTVLMAVVLFFGALSTKLPTRASRKLMFGAAVLMLLGCAAVLASFPITF